MIRVPFFLSSEDQPIVMDAHKHPALDADEAIHRLDLRLARLEQRLAIHADELKSNVSERITRIQSRLERALGGFQLGREEGTEVEENPENVVEFRNLRGGKPGQADHVLCVKNAREAMTELNETLRLTRDHLEALSGSIDKMRSCIPKH